MTHEKNSLLTENASLKLELNNSSRKYRTLHDSEALLREQLEKARGMGRKTSRADLKERPPAKKDDSLSKLAFLTATIKNLEEDISLLNGKLEESYRERDRVDNENRALLTKVSLIEFEMSKTRQEADFQRNLGKREADVIISMLQKDLAVERE